MLTMLHSRSSDFQEPFMAASVSGLGAHSAEVVAAMAETKIDIHMAECAAAAVRVDRRLGRLEVGMVCALLGIIGVLYQNYTTTHPAVTTTTTSVSTSHTAGNGLAPNIILHWPL